MPRQFRSSSEYPRFCPSCGAARQEHREELATTMGEWEPIPYCTRCALEWASIPDPATALTRKLTSLSDKELCEVLKLFYPKFDKLISVVATQLAKSVGHVQRVLISERKSVDIDSALTKEFRRRLQETDTQSLLSQFVSAEDTNAASMSVVSSTNFVNTVSIKTTPLSQVILISPDPLDIDTRGDV